LESPLDITQHIQYYVLVWHISNAIFKTEATLHENKANMTVFKAHIVKKKWITKKDVTLIVSKCQILYQNQIMFDNIQK